MSCINCKRKYFRLNAYHLAKYRLLARSDHSVTITGIKNIGGGGICLQVEEYLPVDSTVQVYINFPKISQPVPAVAKVTWIKALGKKGSYEVGMEFVDIEHIFRDAIIKSADAVHNLSKQKESARSKKTHTTSS